MEHDPERREDLSEPVRRNETLQETLLRVIEEQYPGWRPLVGELRARGVPKQELVALVEGWVPAESIVQSALLMVVDDAYRSSG